MFIPPLRTSAVSASNRVAAYAEEITHINPSFCSNRFLVTVTVSDQGFLRRHESEFKNGRPCRPHRPYCASAP